MTKSEITALNNIVTILIQQIGRSSTSDTWTPEFAELWRQVQDVQVKVPIYNRF